MSILMMYEKWQVYEQWTGLVEWWNDGLDGLYYCFYCLPCYMYPVVFPHSLHISEECSCSLGL